MKTKPIYVLSILALSLLDISGVTHALQNNPNPQLALYTWQEDGYTNEVIVYESEIPEGLFP